MISGEFLTERENLMAETVNKSTALAIGRVAADYYQIGFKEGKRYQPWYARFFR